MELAYSDGETDDEQAGRGDHGTTDAGVGASIGVVGIVVGIQGEGTQGGEDDEPHEHPQTTNDHRDTAAKLLTNVQTTEGREDIDGAQDDGGDVGVRDADSIEDLSTVVKEEVGTGELLQGLQGHADEDTAKHSWSSEDLVPLLLATGLLGLEVLADVTESSLNFGVSLGDLRHKSKSLGGLDLSTAAELPSRGLAHNQHTDGHDGRGNEADTHGNAPGGGRLDSLGAVVDAVGDEDAERDEQLICRDERTTDLARRSLGLIHGRQDRERTNTKSVNETTNDNLVPLVLRSDADDVANNVDDVPEGDAVLSAEPVCNGGRHESTDQAANAEHTDHQTLTDVAELQDAIVHLVTEAVPEVVHLGVAGNGSTFPSENETTQGDE